MSPTPRAEWYVACQDPRMPTTPMSLEEAERQAATCDERWPECAPHNVYRGPAARHGYE